MTAKKKDVADVQKDQPQPTTAPAPAPTPEPAKPEAAAVQQPEATEVKPVAAEAVSKQRQTIDRLRTAWAARGVSLEKLTEQPDGKFVVLVVAEGWPTISIGPAGGGEIRELKSYPKFFEAAVVADQLYAKQQAREQKKTAPAPTTKPTTQAPEKKEVAHQSTTAKKAAADAEIERQLQA